VKKQTTGARKDVVRLSSKEKQKVFFKSRTKGRRKRLYPFLKYKKMWAEGGWRKQPEEGGGGVKES